MINGIVFDFDGTLANTLPVIFACYDYSTEKILGKKADRAPFIETFGLPLKICLTKVFGEETGSRICDEYRAYQELHHDELIQSFPKVKETLEQLQQMQIPMAVVTSKTTATCLRGARCLGIDSYFVTVIGSDIVKHPKPDAEPTRMALERLGTRPEETLCVGDAPFDIMSGKAAGCITAAVEYTQVDAERFKSLVSPDYWLTDLEDLIPLVEGRRRLVMDYYKLLLSHVSALPAGTMFTVGQAYKEGWATIPAKDKITICKKFKTEVDGGMIPRIIFNGYLSGSTHRHKQYKKL